MLDLDADNDRNKDIVKDIVSVCNFMYFFQFYNVGLLQLSFI